MYFFSSVDMMVNNPGYEAPQPTGTVANNNPFASGSPALVYQNVSYQPNHQAYQQTGQTPQENYYVVNSPNEQLVPKSYI